MDADENNKMKAVNVQAVFFLCVGIYISTLDALIIEAEDCIIGNGKIRSIPRSSASEKMSVLLKRGEELLFDICAVSDTVIRVDKIRVSNDGQPDTFSVSLNRNTIFRDQTTPSFLDGKGWNGFQTFHIQKYFPVQKGRHRLLVKVEDADEYGIEVDNIEITLDNNQSEDELLCKVFCFDDIAYKKARRYELDQNLYNYDSFILQRSFRTKCAEEDNVNIPIYSQVARAITVTATNPKYPSFHNNRKADFSNCEMVSSFWMFENIVFESDDTAGDRFHKASIGPKHTKHIHGEVAALITGVNADKMVVNIVFKLEGQLDGVVDADIGSYLYIRVRSSHAPMTISLAYYGRYKVWSAVSEKRFDSEVQEHRWTIPDFTWTDKKENQFRIHLQTREKFVEIEKIELARRYKNQTRVFHMYNDGRYLMEGADVDFWWLINQTMTVRILENGHVFHDADYIRIYAKIPWMRDHFSQVFVIYQDGNVRLLPVTPHGLDWIPFGSSILIGQTDHVTRRPAAPIEHIDISMKKLQLDIFYKDGGYLKLKIIPKFSSTKLLISDMYFKRNHMISPILTFRSMWLSNGNADVDHVSANGYIKPIISSTWQKLRGSSFSFFRKCISSHNTQSPDILVDIKS